MKRSIFVFFLIAATLILLGCSQNQPTSPELSQGDQISTSLAKKPAPKLFCTTEYYFVGYQGIIVNGRLNTWSGTVSGDIEGVIKWWLVLPKPPATGQAGHYEERYEIWNSAETELLLAGNENGTTTVRHGNNSNWRANGTVTEAYGEFEEWIGRKSHAEGHFTWAAPGLPEQGYGSFRIN